MLEGNTRELKVRAQTLKPALRLGKAGLTPEFLASFEDAIAHAELIKVKFEDFKDERKDLSARIAESTGSRLIQQIGHTAVFYRQKT